jgi:hypothetical protein
VYALLEVVFRRLASQTLLCSRAGSAVTCSRTACGNGAEGHDEAGTVIILPDSGDGNAAARTAAARLGAADATTTGRGDGVGGFEGDGMNEVEGETLGLDEALAVTDEDTAVEEVTDGENDGVASCELDGLGVAATDWLCVLVAVLLVVAFERSSYKGDGEDDGVASVVAAPGTSNPLAVVDTVADTDTDGEAEEVRLVERVDLLSSSDLPLLSLPLPLPEVRDALVEGLLEADWEKDDDKEVVTLGEAVVSTDGLPLALVVGWMLLDEEGDENKEAVTEADASTEADDVKEADCEGDDVASVLRVADGLTEAPCDGDSEGDCDAELVSEAVVELLTEPVALAVGDALVEPVTVILTL